MNNFFYSSSDYDLFKKAFRSTKNEPVIINILSDDSSLIEATEAGNTQANVQRKQMSSKFQASPFDKFFGPRKKRTDPLDMKDFSSWKNKNYRESEKQIDSIPEETTKFSFSDYLNNRTKDKMYNSEDELKAENQKPIDQMSSKDDDFKKFSLDSYLNKLEQQTKAKKDFAETDDLVSDFVDENAMANSDVDQDENFLTRSDIGVEDVAFGSEIKGDRFAFDREELDSVKARLEKMEREANNIKDKPTTKVISSNELSDIAKSDEDEETDEFNLDKLGIEDDIEKVNQKMDSINKNLQVTGDGETEKPKVEHKRFVEINKSFDDSETKTETSEKEEYVSASENKSGETEDNEVKGAIDISRNASGGVVGGSSGSTVIVTTSGTASASAETSDNTESMPAFDMSGYKSGATIGPDRAGIVKPVVIVGATANPDELKETEETSSDDNSFVDAVEFIPVEDDEDQTIAGGTDGFEIATGEEFGQDNEIKKSDEYITKTDLRNVTDEIIGKFSEMSRGGQPGQDGFVATGDYANPYGAGYNPAEQIYGPQTMSGESLFAQPAVTDNPVLDQQTSVFGVVGGVGGGQSVDPEFQKKQDELQAQLMELIEQNKKTDEEVAKKLEMAEKEKMRVAEEYENRLRELEASMLKREEAVKQQAYIEKLKNDIKFKKSENKYKLREEQIRESEKSNSQNLLDCEKLKSELRNSLSVSNLEMDKKLLECVNRLHKAEIEKQEQKVEELQQDLKEEMEKPSSPKPKTTPKRRPSTVRSRMRTRTPRRKIDSDIIGGINFD